MLSIVIPTRQRPQILQQCLERLCAQTMAKDLEIIVVHDGEDSEDTMRMLHDHAPSAPAVARFTFFAIPKSQQGTARNRGMERVNTELTLFINDDILLAPDACEKHIAAHRMIDGPAAVLGYMSWDPSLDITPAMRWLDKTGWQFGYHLLAPYRHNFVPQHMQHRFTYASFISAPTAVIRAHPFHEEFTMYGWEDILWGTELAESGIPLYYESDACAFHYHRISLQDSLQRIEMVGKSLLHLQRLEPDHDRIPHGWKLIAYRLIAMLPTMRGKHYRAFLRGMQPSTSRKRGI